jgi:sulfur-carrier protein
VVSSNYNPMASITVKLFAAYQEAYGKPEVVLEVASGLTVAEVGDRIRTSIPLLRSRATA